MKALYDLWLVALSVCVGTLASYTFIDVLRRLSSFSGGMQKHVRLAGGALSMGIGIWSMHFIGMMAFSLPITVGYDFRMTAVSLALAIGVAYFALGVIARREMSLARILFAGTLMGFGIAAMHFTGMAAMRMSPGIVYNGTLVVAAVAIAVVASMTALLIVGRLSRRGDATGTLTRIGAALVLGAAIAGMHYTGMAAAQFLPGSICLSADGLNGSVLASIVTGSSVIILVITLLVLSFDKKAASLTHSVSTLTDQVVRMASFDSLTDLPNRRTLSERVELAIMTAQHTNKQFAILFLDLDGFKTINDSLGHSVGDQLLKAFSQRLLRCVRLSDTVARLGGDEFVVLVTDVASRDDVETLATSMLDRMRRGAWSDGQPLQVVPSIGIALYPRDGNSPDELLKNADAAMYEAKRGGRGTYRFFETEMSAAATRTLQIQHALHEALEHGYFSLHFQPKFYGEDSRLAGAEALLRFRHPEIGALSPMEFIPIAERSGQIVQIGAWVVLEACRQLNRWKLAGLPAVKIAINLSVRQLDQPDIVDRIISIVTTEKIDPAQLMFEITESVAMQDAPRAVEIFKAFHAHGFEIAIDDFGTGYSSLAYLQQFRVKQLKIDRFFTNGLDEQGEEGAAIVQAIISLAHSLKMDVVAEGVETASQLRKLKLMMCDEIQGFHVGMPVEADRFAELLGASQSAEVGA